MLTLQEAFKPIIESHLRWLDDFDDLYKKQWERLLGSAEESALCEAVFREVLQQHGCTVAPNEDLTGTRRAPDFTCSKGTSQFYLEVTCIDAAVVERKCGGDVSRCGDSMESGSFGLLNDAILDACKKKVKQLVDLPAPRVLAIGTFHKLASMICISSDALSMLLTGTLGVAFGCDPETGALTGNDRVVTQLEGAVFAKPEPEKTFSLARLPISAVLVGGLAVSPPRIFGLLHPSPMMEFDSRTLGDIPFCRLKQGYKHGEFAAEWIQTSINSKAIVAGAGGVQP